MARNTLPAAPERRLAGLGDLSGGLNLRRLDYCMDASQSPDMKNLWWHDGLLCCRDGQEYVSDEALGQGFCCAPEPYYGWFVAHIGDGIYAARPGSSMALQELCSGIPQVRGTFVRYHGALLYKTAGAYKQITGDEQALTVSDVTPYVPVTVINCTPEGAGDLYQPENRLSAEKTVWYTAAVQTYTAIFTADGSAVNFHFTVPDSEPVAKVLQVYAGTTLLPESDYTLSEDLCTVMLNTAPANGETVTAVYTVGVRVYHLPVEAVDSITRVLVDGTPVTAYTADLQAGTVTFAAAPPVQDPPVNNTVQITYSKANEGAAAAIMNCRYACAYGGTGGAVLVMAGSEAQPNAYFWNGSHIAMDAGYFPVSSYNLAGDSLEPVTGFGLQAGYLMIFKSHAIGRCLLATQTIDDRAYLTLEYTPVNASIGCDLPWTVRLVDNNLVWCNTYLGVCRLEDTNLAMENRVTCISANVNGSDARPGLLAAVKDAADVCALEDGERYWLCADGTAFLWDHALSSAAKPSWFRFTAIKAVDFFRGDVLPSAADDGLSYTGARRIYHLDRQGRVSRFVRTFRDYGRGIEKVYTFAAQDFGSLQQRKTVRRVLLTTRSDTDTEITVEYLTDGGKRTDKTPIGSHCWRLAPRNLARRSLSVRRFGFTAVRTPMCRDVRWFSLRLTNDVPGCDMAVVSAEFTAELLRKER